MSFDPKNFRELDNSDSLYKFMEEQGSSHGNNYFHYTTLSKINNIIETKKIWFSPVSNFNDDFDKKQFETHENSENSEMIYSFCFTTGRSENLALWYLYSGTDGKGGRIQLNKSIIKEICGSDCLYFECDSINTSNNDSKCELFKTNDVYSDDYSIECKDIIYWRNSRGNTKTEDNVYIKYRNATNSIIKQSDFSDFKKKYNGFLKNIVWYYEKETRIVVTLKPNGIEKIKAKFNGIPPGHIAYKIPEISKIKILFAPELENIKKIPDNLNYLLSFIENNENNCKYSELTGKVHMNLCKNCEKAKAYNQSQKI